jgi:hypothetical protein
VCVTEREREREEERKDFYQINNNIMSSQRAESASSRFVNAIGKKKDVQSDEAGRRPPLLSPANTRSVSDDELDLSPSNTSNAHGTRYVFTTTATSLGGSWKKQLISNQIMIHPENKKYIAI